MRKLKCRMIKEKKEKEVVRMDSSTGTKNIEIYIKFLTGKLLTCLATNEWTIDMVMQYIKAKEGIPPSQQQILFKQNNLSSKNNSNKTLSEHGITDCTTLFCYLNLRGD